MGCGEPSPIRHTVTISNQLHANILAGLFAIRSQWLRYSRKDIELFLVLTNSIFVKVLWLISKLPSLVGSIRGIQHYLADLLKWKWGVFSPQFFDCPSNPTLGFLVHYFWSTFETLSVCHARLTLNPAFNCRILQVAAICGRGTIHRTSMTCKSRSLLSPVNSLTKKALSLQKNWWVDRSR